MGKEEITYELTDQPVIFQGTALGKCRRRRAVPPDYTQSRRVEIGLVWDEAEGDLIPIPYRLKDYPPRDDFPTIGLKQARQLREQMLQRDLDTVIKHGASRQFIEVDPNKGKFQIPKPRHSFALIP